MRRLALSSALALLAATACNPSDAVVVNTADTADTVFITPSEVELEVGRQATLTPTALNALGVTIAADFAWASSRPSVASVTADGVVTGLSVGSAEINAVAGGLAATATVTVVSSSPPPAFTLEVDGSGHDVGQLPVVAMTLVDVSGTPEDIYPVGDDDPEGAGACVPTGTDPTPCLYVFGVFDTGSEILKIDNANAQALRIDGLGASDPRLEVAVRLHGIQAIDPASLLGRIFEPGQAFGADVQVGPLRVGVRAPPTALIGAPVTNEVVALMRLDIAHTRGPYPGGGSQTGPEITFFQPGSPGIPTPAITLPLQRVPYSVASVAATGDGYLHRDVAFRNSPAGTTLEVTDDPGAPSPYSFFLDTGTTVTIINDRVAQALGLVDASLTPQVASAFDCLGGTGNGFRIDAVEMLGAEGTYRVTDALVCWSPSSIITRLPSGTLVDVVTGTNLFDHGPVVFDGAAATLGVGSTSMPAQAAEGRARPDPPTP